MKVITNDFLLCLAKNKNEMGNLIGRGVESGDLKEIDNERKLKAGKSFIDSHLEREKFIQLRKAVDKKYYKQLTSIALTLYYAQEYQSARSEILSQIKMCENFLASDMCKRNVDLHFFVFTEYQKLKSIDFGNLVPQALSAFDKILKDTYPTMSQRKRYIELSELMNSLELYTNDRKPFLTLQMATKEAEEKSNEDPDYSQSGEDIIVDRIKNSFKKK